MRVWFALCGNSYSQSLFRLAAPDFVVRLSHRSNASSGYEKLISVLRLMLAVILRISCAVTRGEFLMCVPHDAGNYQKLLKLLRPTDIAVIDDGITFEYWSDFHERHITPILLDRRCRLLIGPREPDWFFEKYKHCRLLLRSRSLVVKDMADFFPFRGYSPGVESGAFFAFVDDGKFSLAQISHISDFLKARYAATVLVVAHPTRQIASCPGAIKLCVPIEKFLLEFENKLVGVFGKGSTALFNIVAANASLPILSLRTNISDLDTSMEKAGIKLIDIGSTDVV